MYIFTSIVGYLGMLLIVSSFLMKEVKSLRFINMCGALLSMIYGILTSTIPTAILNGTLLIINGIYMIRYIKKEKQDDRAKNKLN